MAKALRLLFLLISCSLFAEKANALTYTWSGGFFNSNWTAGINWSKPFGAPAYPTAADDVIIPQIFEISGIINYPVIASGESFSCRTLTFGGSGGVGIRLTINGTLSVTNGISVLNGTGSTDATVTGSGALNAASLTVGNGSPTTGTTNTTTFNSHIAALNVTGAIVATTTGNVTRTNNAIFNVVNDVRACTVTASSIDITGATTIATSSASINLLNAGAFATTLRLTGATPISIQSSVNGTVDLYNTGTGTSTVEFAATSGTQSVATNAISGLTSVPSIYQNIVFSGAATKSFNTGSATISGNWTSAGGSVNAINATVIFQGPTQSLTDAGSNSGAGVLFRNVTFQGGGTKTISGTAGQTSAFSVSSLGTLTLAGTSTLAVGAYGSLTLRSTAAGDARVAVIPAGCTITGSVNVQRYFKAGTVATTRNYRLLSSPVNASSAVNNTAGNASYSLSYLSSSSGVYTGGPGGPASGFTVANTAPTVYLYKESLQASNTTFNSGNFKGLTNITGSTVTPYNDAGTAAASPVNLYAGNGYMLYYVGNNVNNLTSTTTANKQFRVGGIYIDPDAATATATGTLNQGQIPVRVYWSGSTTLSNARTGFNLVGNPYASTIDWDTFSSSSSSAGIYAPGVSNSVYVFNYTNKNYGVYQAGTGGLGTNNSSRYIASGQGFFVKATTASATLTFNEAAKSTQQPAVVLMGLPAEFAQQPQLLRIRLAKDTVDTDESLVLFGPGAANTDDENDVPRLSGIGNVATLATYSKQGTQMLAINRQAPIDSKTRIRLHVGMTGAASRDTLTISGFDSLDPRYNCFLVDHYRNDSLQISTYGKYLFNIRPDSATSYGANRFELVFHKKADFSYRLLSFSGVKTADGIKLTWKTEREQNSTGFVLQKADGSQTYIPLYNLQSNGSGTYTYTDPSPNKGANTYRLQQNDPFGATRYSLPISIDYQIGNVNELLVAYPNPVISDVNVKINTTNVPDKVLLRVIDFSGRALINKAVAGNNIQENLSQLTSGNYIIEVTDAATQKVIGRTKISKP